MNINEFREQMFSYRQAAEEEAASMKDPYVALDRLYSLYKKFDAEERTMANQVLAEWTLSDSEKLRFEAMALIDDFHIVSAIPTLRELATRLAATNTPGAPFELQKVERIIQDLDKQTKKGSV